MSEQSPRSPETEPRQQAQRLALTDQSRPGVPVSVPSVALESRRPWWRRLVLAGASGR
jgi:hypothetical protein